MLSNWLGTGAPPLPQYASVRSKEPSAAVPLETSAVTQQTHKISRYPGDAVGSYSAHVMWTKSLDAGGVVGGNIFSSSSKHIL